MTVLNFPSDTSQSPYEANGITYVWDGQKWTAYGDGFAGTTVHVGPTPPVGTPNEGDLWWHDEEARLYVYYVDDDSSQWVDASPGGGSGGGGGGSDYVLPPATNSELGGVKVGARLTVSADGTLSADIQGGGGTTVGSLQDVTDVGNTTDNAIVTDSYLQTGAHTADTGLIQLLTGTSDVTKEAIRFIESDTSTRSFIVQSDGTTKLGGNAGSAPNISLNSDGRAVIKSDLTPLEVTRNTTTTGNALMQWRSNNGGTDIPQAKCLADGSFYIGGDVINNIPNITLTGDGQIKARSTKVVSETVRKVAAVIGSTHSIKKAGPTTEVIIQQTQCDGTLYIGGDDTNANITLGATGSASFAQDVKIGGVLPDSPNITLQADGDIHVVGQVYSGANAFLGQGTGSRLSADGAIYTSRDNADAPAFTAYVTSDSNPKVLIRSGGTIELGANAASAPTHILNTSGTAYHGGVVTVGTIDITTDGVGGCEVRNDGLLRAQRPSNKTSSAVFQGWCGTDLVSPTSQISAGGTAVFANDVKSGDLNGGRTDRQGSNLIHTGGLYTQFLPSADASTSRGLRIYHGDDENCTIFANGSAQFAGNVSSDALFRSVGSSAGFVAFTDNTATVIAVRSNNGVNDKVLIKGDGSADFAGGVCKIDPAGYITVDRTISTQNLIEGKLNGVQTSVINADGSASFSGSVAIGGQDAAHTMDVYEEGTFTPTMDGGNPTIGNVGTISASYTRIGNVVHFVTIVAQTSNNMSFAAGNYRINGLPFIPNNTFIVNAQAMENNNALLNDLPAQVLGTNPGDIFFQVSADQSAVLGSTRIFAVSGTYTTDA